jgi:4-hydroxythreonine-4-phosphate dehydrogenase
MGLPRLILTSGEPAGIGPDLCIAVAARAWPCDLVVAADTDLLAARASELKASIRLLKHTPGEPRRAHEPGSLRVLHVPVQAPVRAGVLDRANAGYVLRLLDVAIEGWRTGEFDALVTAPVQKSVINDAGIVFFGHTEYLAENTGGAQPVMLLASGELRVALATTHVPLADVSRSITTALLDRVLRTLERDLRTRFGIDTPRILVCGLNPHAGESGHLGREEIDVIAPTLEHLRREGLRLLGPVPADTAFAPHMLKQADAVLAMFHDQGLPVIKYAGFGAAVNVTLGLPIIRTSVDHGTALSLAGSGRADAGSLAAAIELAIRLARPATSNGR